MSAWNYIASVQKATAISHLTTAFFTTSEPAGGNYDHNLILAKSNRLEVYKLTQEGLERVIEVNLFGTISFLVTIPEHSHCDSRDLLFVGTEDPARFSLLSFDNGKIITRSSGELHQSSLNQSKTRPMCYYDHQGKYIAIHLYQHFVKILPLTTRSHGEIVLKAGFDVRLEDPVVLDMKPLPSGHSLRQDRSAACPYMGMMCKTNHNKVVFKVMQLIFQEKELIKAMEQDLELDEHAHFIIPLSNGVLVAFPEYVAVFSYYNCSLVAKCRFNSPSPLISPKIGIIDQSGALGQESTSLSTVPIYRWLIGDLSGHLLVLTCTIHQDATSSVGTTGSVRKRQTSYDVSASWLGQTSPPAALCYLDNNFIFIGSAHGRSQLIELHSEKTSDPDRPYLTVCEEFENLGPIPHFAVRNVERENLDLVLCSGFEKYAALTTVRQGITISIEAEIPIDDVRGLWSFKNHVEDEYFRYIAFTFINETKVLGLEDANLEEKLIPGLEVDSRTLFCGNFYDNTIIQALGAEIRLIHLEKGLVSKWSPPNGGSVVNCLPTQNQVLVALAHGNLLSLCPQTDGSLNQQASLHFGDEISAVTTTGSLCAVALWQDMSIRLLTFDTLQEIFKYSLQGEIIPRSLQFIEYDKSTHLLCGLGDGFVLNFSVNVDSSGEVSAQDPLTFRSSYGLGKHPIRLESFQNNGVNNVLALGDAPSLFFPWHNKLHISSVNTKRIDHMCPFHADGFGNSLALVANSQFYIGSFDNLQTLHTSRYSLPNVVHITSVPHAKSLVALLSSTPSSPSKICLLDSQDYTIKDEFIPSSNEIPNCTLLTTFNYTNDPMIVVGTYTKTPQIRENAPGRLLLFKVDEQHLTLVAQQTTRLGIKTMCNFGDYLLAGIDDYLTMWKPCGLNELDNWNIGKSNNYSVNRTQKESCQEADMKIDSEEDQRAQRRGNDGQHLCSFELVCERKCRVLIVKICVTNELIVVGDLMKSVLVYCFDSKKNRINEISKDRARTMVHTVHTLGENVILASDWDQNLYTLRYHSDEEHAVKKLEIVGEFHVAEDVTVLQSGKISRNNFEDGNLDHLSEKFAELVPKCSLECTLYGTVQGSLGIIVSLPEPTFAFLDRLQREIVSTTISTVGNLEFLDWRTRRLEGKKRTFSGFIDGDLVEGFLTLGREEAQRILANLQIPEIQLTDVYWLLSQLSRMH